MKKKVFIMLPCIAVVAVTMSVVCKTFKLEYCNGSELFAQNVEALSNSDEGGYDSSECNSGVGRWASVEVATGKAQTRVHYSDGAKGNYGMDEIFDIEYKRCVAYGRGSKKGANYSWPTGKGPSTYEECKGPNGHYGPAF